MIFATLASSRRAAGDIGLLGSRCCNMPRSTFHSCPTERSPSLGYNISLSTKNNAGTPYLCRSTASGVEGALDGKAQGMSWSWTVDCAQMKRQASSLRQRVSPSLHVSPNATPSRFQSSSLQL